MEFTFELEDAGWARASVTADGQTVNLSASYLKDALGDLLLAVRTVLDGAAEASASWLRNRVSTDGGFSASMGACECKSSHSATTSHDSPMKPGDPCSTPKFPSRSRPGLWHLGPG